MNIERLLVHMVGEGDLEGEGQELEEAVDEVMVEQMADDILQGFAKYMRGPKAFFVRKLVRKVRNRFDRDGVDEVALEYIIAKIFRDFGVFEELDAIFAEALRGREQKVADLIIFDIRSVLNGRLVRTFASSSPRSFATNFGRIFSENGLSDREATAVMKRVWEKVQEKFGV